MHLAFKGLVTPTKWKIPHLIYMLIRHQSDNIQDTLVSIKYIIKINSACSFLLF